MTQPLNAYIAGPHLYLPDALSLVEKKRALCEKYRFRAVFGHEIVPNLAGLSREQQGMAIARAVESALRQCDLMIANLTPFHGPHCDTGTAWQIGLMRGLNKPVFGWSNTSQSLFERLQEWFKGTLHRGESGDWQTPQGHLVENFGLKESMLVHYGAESGGVGIVTNSVPAERLYTDLSGFDRVCYLAAREMCRS